MKLPYWNKSHFLYEKLACCWNIRLYKWKIEFLPENQVTNKITPTHIYVLF